MQTYTDEIKAQVRAEWKAGTSYRSLSRLHGVPVSTIQGWVEDVQRTQLVQKKTEYDLDEMAMRLIDGSVSAVSSIHDLATNDAWLQRQNAADVAVLLGVISDKLYRLLGAIQPQTSRAPDGG